MPICMPSKFQCSVQRILRLGLTIGVIIGSGIGLIGCQSNSTRPSVAKAPLPRAASTVLLERYRLNNQLPFSLNYLKWLAEPQHRVEVSRYESYLQQQHVLHVVPTHHLLRSARDWQKCNAQPYLVPSTHLWSNIVPTLQVIQRLQRDKVLTDFEVTSVYRDEGLNQCAGGALRSKHVNNSAIDIRIGPEQITTSAQIRLINDSKTRLCEFWRQYGQEYQLGLGLYASGQIHLDTQGYRTWGPDHTSASSICA